ncbi:hypothetical protein, partial [Umezakia ovalisporum]|uniref:hypothetical protein n=1 Tax=Umezakia ovalisporum TaxID=75695 RepID=UPI0039C6317E
VGVNQVVLSVRDVNGNVAEALALVTVYDTLAPVVNTQNINVYLNASGVASITPAMINQNSSDACGIDSLWLNTTQFTCNAVGVNQVVLSARDVNGNVSSKIA